VLKQVVVVVVIKKRRRFQKSRLRFGVLGVLALSLSPLQAQQGDPYFKSDTLNKTSVEILYSQYLQDGDRSAVTGGIGTEKLIVYGPSLRVKKTNSKNQEWAISGGADVISSASTDNINSILSSASRVDTRGYLNVDYAQPVAAKKDWELNLGTGISMESDYLSVPIKLGLSHTSPDQMRSYFFSTQCNLDDLRWGRFDDDYYKPVKLIYPSELRDTAWFDNYVRQSYNFKFGMTQVINKRMILGIFPSFTFQKGLLSTPFHRVYFNDGQLRVENLPSTRRKYSLGFKLNTFVAGNLVLRNDLDFYHDDFDITSFSFGNETAILINPKWTLTPFVRYYIQSRSKYFASFQDHRPDEQYYTSDYDLSKFRSYKAGLSIRYAPFINKRRIAYDSFLIRYAYYSRTDGLRAHIISFVANGAFYSRRKEK